MENYQQEISIFTEICDMLKATFQKHQFTFKIPGGTSRGVLTTKDSWFLIIKDSNEPGITGIGECSIIKNLSIDDRPDFELKLKEVCAGIENYNYWLSEGLVEFPAIRFGLETALLDLNEMGKRHLFPSGRDPPSWIIFSIPDPRSGWNLL